MGFDIRSPSVALLICAFAAVVSVHGRTLQTDATGFDAKMADADTLMQRRQFEDALRIYKDANGLRGKKSAPALLGMARAYMGLLEPKKAVDAASDALKYVAGDPHLEANARNLRGIAHFALGGPKTNDKRWTQAEEDFRVALSLSDQLPVARYNLGVALLKQGRDDEGVLELQEFLEGVAKGPDAINARKYIANPRHARENFAPAFSLTTLAGESLSSEDLLGKVVLIDFWATWCGPCVAATPGLARIHQKLASDSFVILGVSADRSPDAWRKFIEEKKLGWPQYLDAKRMMAGLFGVSGYPTYILVDHEGIVRYQHQGWNPSVDGDIEYEARKLLKAIPRPGQ
jgi:thiol-disulfide isomerase/thioredoxin